MILILLKGVEDGADQILKSVVTTTRRLPLNELEMAILTLPNP
jgi:hypothetical protein